jgi:hypothetical protein
MVADSLGGRLPGDDLVQDDPASHPHPYYTPIAHIGSKYVAEPVFYGMKFAQQFAGATIVPIDFDPGTVNATAFAARPAEEILAGVVKKDAAKMVGQMLVAIINKDATQPLTVKLPAVPVAVDTISAASLTSTDVKQTRAPLSPGTERVVPPHSMAVFRIQF